MKKIFPLFALFLCAVLVACTPAAKVPGEKTALQTPLAEQKDTEVKIASDDFGTSFEDLDELQAYMNKTEFAKPVRHYLTFDDTKGVLKVKDIVHKGSYITVQYTLADGRYENYWFSVRISLFETTDDGGFVSHMQKTLYSEPLKTEKREVNVFSDDFEKPEGGWGKTEVIFWQEDGEDICLYTPFWIYDYYTTEEIVNNLVLVPLK